MSDSVKTGVTHIAFIVMYAACWALKDFGPFKDQPMAMEALASAITWLYGHIMFAGNETAMTSKLAKMDPEKRAQLFNRAERKASSK